MWNRVLIGIFEGLHRIGRIIISILVYLFYDSVTRSIRWMNVSVALLLIIVLMVYVWAMGGTDPGVHQWNSRPYDFLKS